MRQPIRFIIVLTTALSIVSTNASAFQSITSSLRTISILPKVNSNKIPLLGMMTPQHAPVLRLRGGASDTAAKIVAAPPKKIRIAAFDSMRFFLIMNIVLGHFGRFANPSDKLLTAFSQHNVMVGAFFALSGYVTVRLTTLKFRVSTHFLFLRQPLTRSQTVPFLANVLGLHNNGTWSARRFFQTS